jgi:hypothetical protein
MNRPQLLALLMIATAVSGCGLGQLPNPSGTCGSRTDGGRAGYHAPGDTQWLPDCQAPLRREYWRVFSEDGKIGYIIPRPDGAPELSPVCGDPGHELRDLVLKHALCEAASSPAAVEAVNSIPAADALRLTRFLHGKLKFLTTQTGLGIQPFPIPGDIVDACGIRGGSASADLRAICERERDRLRSGHDIGFTYTGPGAVELVERLNELYGIP